MAIKLRRTYLDGQFGQLHSRARHIWANISLLDHGALFGLRLQVS